MAVADQTVTSNYALYNGDCIAGMKSLPEGRVDLSIYSPPFCSVYNYSSDEKDLSNCMTYAEFLEHYRYCIRELHRITKPGRITAVHCMDIPGRGYGDSARTGSGANAGVGLIDFPGDIIRAHEDAGFHYAARRTLWKEPLQVRNRTMAKGLSHKQVCDDATMTDVANADYIITFRKGGENPIPAEHPGGLLSYSGERQMPSELLRYKGWTGKQTENRFSHWIWRQYASSVWDDIRWGRTLPYQAARDKDDERHVHPLQLDVIERCVILFSNPGEVVLTPFMGVGSEVFGAVINGRKGIGFELKPSYYRQAVRNLAEAHNYKANDGQDSFLPDEEPDLPQVLAGMDGDE